MGLDLNIRNFYNDYLPESIDVLYAVPSGHRIVIKTIVLRSENSTQKEIDIKLRRSGNTVIISPEYLLEQHTWVHDAVETLEEGDLVLGSTETGSLVTCKINGILEKL